MRFIKKQFNNSEFTLSQNEVKVIIHSTSSFRDRCLLKCLYYAGLRREEVIKLDIRDIDFQRRRIIVRHGKGDKQRIVPFIDFEFMGDLKHLIGERKEGLIFPISIRAVNFIVSKAGIKSGIQHPNPHMKNINPHLFRHSIARHLKSQNFNVEAIQNFLGHSSYKTTMDTYGTMSVDEMQSIFDKKFGLIPNNSPIKRVDYNERA